jgi:hypothetical protein
MLLLSQRSARSAGNRSAFGSATTRNGSLATSFLSEDGQPRPEQCVASPVVLIQIKPGIVSLVYRVGSPYQSVGSRLGLEGR